jgi:transcriptional regulator with XRE-family HTH domain
MTGAELRSIRQSLGLTQAQFGEALGYRGNENSRKVKICQYETGVLKIHPRLAVSARNLGASYFGQQNG